MIVSYARDIPHYTFLEMEESIKRAHQLFKKKNTKPEKITNRDMALRLFCR